MRKNGLLELKAWDGKKKFLRGLTFLKKVSIVIYIRKRKALDNLRVRSKYN